MENKKKAILQKRYQRQEEKERMKTRCPHCGIGRLHSRGPIGASGYMRWKCRDCGRTVWERKDPSPPEPVVPISNNQLL